MHDPADHSAPELGNYFAYIDYFAYIGRLARDSTGVVFSFDNQMTPISPLSVKPTVWNQDQRMLNLLYTCCLVFNSIHKWKLLTSLFVSSITTRHEGTRSGVSHAER